MSASAATQTGASAPGREAERAALERVPHGLYIAGEWRPASAGGTLPVEDPSTQEPLVEVADAQEGDALAALAAAADSQAECAATAPRDRGGLHDARQARPADAPVDARAGAGPRAGGASGRRAQRDHLLALGGGDRAAAEGLAHAQAVVHRLHRGRAQADRPVG